MNATGSPSTYSLYNTGEPGLAIDLLPRYNEISFWRVTGPNGNLTWQKMFWMTNAGTQLRVGTANTLAGVANFGGSSPSFILTRGGDATSTTTYNSNPLQLESSGWDTGASTFVNRMITLTAVAGSGSTGNVPYRLSLQNDTSTEMFNIDALTGNVGVGQVSTTNMYGGITIKSQGFRNVGLGLATPNGITFQDRQDSGNGAGISLSDDDTTLNNYTWDGAHFQPRLSIVEASGNVGIGNSSPGGIFVVSSSIIFASSTTGYVGIGTTTPAVALQVASASSTIMIGANGLPGCLEMGNSDGSAGVNYITVKNGTLSATTTKPNNCR